MEQRSNAGLPVRDWAVKLSTDTEVCMMYAHLAHSDMTAVWSVHMVHVDSMHWVPKSYPQLVEMTRRILLHCSEPPLPESKIGFPVEIGLAQELVSSRVPLACSTDIGESPERASERAELGLSLIHI